MTIEQWQPATAASTPDSKVLKQVAAQCDEFMSSPAGSKALNPVQPWAHLAEDDWQAAFEGLSTDELKALAQMFTLAEEHFGNWQLGSGNPAIWVCRYLKRMDQYPDKDFIRQLKSLSSNRYIPRGKVM